MKERCDREMAAALLLVLFKKIRGWDHTSKQLNSQQRGQHRRLGNAHGAREDPEAASFRRAGNAPWAALAGCIMPPNLFGHTTSGLHVRQAAMRWGCKQSRPLPRAVRAAKLCPRCSPSPGRELQIRRKKTIATILATIKGENPNFKFS